jgi:uncharacterized Zn finger protein (UPF0148 family)
MIYTLCPACHRLVCLHRHGGEDVLMGIVCPSCVDAMRAEARTAKESEAAAVQRLGDAVWRRDVNVAFAATRANVELTAEVRRLRHYIADQSRELMEAEARADAMERAGQAQARRANENWATLAEARAELSRVRDDHDRLQSLVNAVRAVVKP